MASTNPRGISTSEALEFAISLLTKLPTLVQAGLDVVAVINEGREKLEAMQRENRGPTDEEWDALNASIDSRLDQLNSPSTGST